MIPSDGQDTIQGVDCGTKEGGEQAFPPFRIQRRKIGKMEAMVQLSFEIPP